MISKDMYRLLKRIPRWPENKSQKQIDKILFINKFLKLHLLMSGIQCGYIGTNGKGDNEGFYLTESGREAIEEYRRGRSSSTLSIIALIISILSFLTSILK